MAQLGTISLENNAMRRITLAGLAALSVLAGPALAQQADKPADAATPAPGSEEWLRLRGETYRSAPDSEQDPAEVAATIKLNAGIAAANAAADQADAEAQAAFEAENARWRAETAAVETARAQWEADAAAAEAAQRRWEREQAAWEAEMAACRASGRRCLTTPPTAP